MIHDHLNADEAEAAGLIANARRLVVLTGAGISTTSGIPDFRGPEGIWTKNPGAEALSTYKNFMGKERIRKAHWASDHYAAMADFEPNAGHVAIAAMNPRVIITQNIDGLHQKAGSPGDNVLEMHGTVHTASCQRCKTQVPVDAQFVRLIRDSYVDGELRCPCYIPPDHEKQCGGIIKRDIVMFGEQLDSAVWDRAERNALSADVMLCVGSTLSVFPVATLPGVTTRMGGKVIIVNDGATEFDDRAALVLPGNATEILPRLVP